jgi:hypothetical protein
MATRRVRPRGDEHRQSGDLRGDDRLWALRVHERIRPGTDLVRYQDPPPDECGYRTFCGTQAVRQSRGGLRTRATTEGPILFGR